VTRGSLADVLISDPAAGEWRLQCPLGADMGMDGFNLKGDRFGRDSLRNAAKHAYFPHWTLSDILCCFKPIINY